MNKENDLSESSDEELLEEITLRLKGDEKHFKIFSSEELLEEIKERMSFL